MIMGIGFSWEWDSHCHGNGIPIPIGNPMGMGIDDTIGNENGKEWESPYMGMGMALIPMGINSYLWIQCLAYLYSNIQVII